MKIQTKRDIDQISVIKLEAQWAEPAHLSFSKIKIDNFSLKIIVLTSIDHLRSIDRDG
jgi:hypothetical protein